MKRFHKKIILTFWATSLQSTKNAGCLKKPRSITFSPSVRGGSNPLIKNKFYTIHIYALESAKNSKIR